MKARIIYIDPNTKTVRLSARLHVMELRAPNDLPALGVYMYSNTILIHNICIYFTDNACYIDTPVYTYTFYSHISCMYYTTN